MRLSSVTPRPTTEATRRHWDSLAAAYDRLKDRNAAYAEHLCHLVMMHVPAPARMRVLEAGCGTGWLLASLRPRAGLGIDLSERMIERARRAHGHQPGLRFEVADASGAPGSPPVHTRFGRFTAIVCADVLEHVPDWQAALDALLSACEPGARLVITTPNPLWALPLWMLEKLRLKMPEGPHAYVHRRLIAEHLRARGCAIERAGTELLLPIRGIRGRPMRGRPIRGRSILSRAARRTPILRDLGVIQVIVANSPATTSPRSRAVSDRPPDPWEPGEPGELRPPTNSAASETPGCRGPADELPSANT